MAATSALGLKMIRLLTALIFIIVANTAVAQSEYRARSGDTLVIEVLEDSSLNRSVVILPGGRFSFPFAGTVVGAGRTVGQIETSIASGIASNFATTPTVFVSVVPRVDPNRGTKTASSATIDIYFLGEVNTPGLREVSPGTTFLQAVAQSGGLSRFAATKRLQLRRTDRKTGQQTVQTFNYKAVLDGAVMAKDPKLKDGDVILVPERRLFE